MSLFCLESNAYILVRAANVISEMEFPPRDIMTIPINCGMGIKLRFVVVEERGVIVMFVITSGSVASMMLPQEEFGKARWDANRMFVSI